MRLTYGNKKQNTKRLRYILKSISCKLGNELLCGNCNQPYSAKIKNRYPNDCEYDSFVQANPKKSSINFIIRVHITLFKTSSENNKVISIFRYSNSKKLIETQISKRPYLKHACKRFSKTFSIVIKFRCY